MKIPIFPGKYHQNGEFSMAMLVYRRVRPVFLGHAGVFFDHLKKYPVALFFFLLFIGPFFLPSENGFMEPKSLCVSALIGSTPKTIIQPDVR